MSRTVAMVYFREPQQPPESKAVDGGVSRLSRSAVELHGAAAGATTTYEFEETPSGLVISRREFAALYPWHTVRRIRYEPYSSAEPKTAAKK